MIYGETLKGLASSFIIDCPFCGAENTVSTSKSHKSGKRGPMAYDTNSRAVLGALHTGFGHTHLSGVLSTLNIPPMNHVLFKTREREVGKAVEQVASNSCSKFIEKEKENALNGN